MKKNTVQKTALTAMLCAQAIALSFLEGMLPSFAFLPPGAKLGFSNIVTMFCAETMGFGYAMTVTVFKSLFALVTRGATAFFMSLAGGVLSTAAMCFLMRIKKFEIGYIGIAVPSAICHNAGQLAVSVIISGTKQMIMYAPILLAAAGAAGVLTGILLKAVMPLLIKQNKFFSEGVG